MLNPNGECASHQNCNFSRIKINVQNCLLADVPYMIRFAFLYNCAAEIQMHFSNNFKNGLTICLTLLRPMECSIKFDTVRSGWSIVYIEGSQVIISKKYLSFLKINFVLAKSADPDEMPHYAAFHLGLHCLPKYWFRCFWSSKD